MRATKHEDADVGAARDRRQHRRRSDQMNHGHAMGAHGACQRRGGNRAGGRTAAITASSTNAATFATVLDAKLGRNLLIQSKSHGVSPQRSESECDRGIGSRSMTHLSRFFCRDEKLFAQEKKLSGSHLLFEEKVGEI